MINSYFSDTEAVEACICRLNVMRCDEAYRAAMFLRVSISLKHIYHAFVFSALTPLVGRQEEHLASKS